MSRKKWQKLGKNQAHKIRQKWIELHERYSNFSKFNREVVLGQLGITVGTTSVQRICRNDSYPDPTYESPKDIKRFDRAVERMQADEYKHRCPVCGMGVVSNPKNVQRYGKPMTFEEAQDCCREADLQLDETAGRQRDTAITRLADKMSEYFRQSA